MRDKIARIVWVKVSRALNAALRGGLCPTVKRRRGFDPKNLLEVVTPFPIAEIHCLSHVVLFCFVLSLS